MKKFLLLMTSIISSYCFNPNDYITIPFLKFPDSLSYNVLEINSIFEYLIACIYIGLFYYSMYFCISQILVWSHPAPKTPERIAQTKEEMRRGFKALFYVILLTTGIIWKVQPLNPYYGYYETHEFGLKEFFISLIIYMVTFDVWFYTSHIIGHTPFFWKHFHGEHHEFVEPGAYAQDAVHPVEALIQGPIGHFLPTFIYPFHPLCHHIFGLLTSIYAQLAHDGRWDPAGHTLHHYYYSCNFSIWGLCDFIFGTGYNQEKYPIPYIPTWLRSKVNNKNHDKKIM
ncbi:unnamed protein product [Paramecium pentaurelia]|uniref:Fatty acid hydroxylase domain-containing protein n=1 Tax=Paramecium pentaurelia TaxID=43138 RepID=A0A8S1W8J1_9CILI|nr:unnamed protein product [Paramecium pentaurelia]